MFYNSEVQFKKIDEALVWIMQRRKAQGFAHFSEVIEDLGHPEKDFKLIHVAGTNGKGSCVTYIRDGLMALGYKVGTLQSPHYKTHLDRIRINGIDIDERTFLDILNEKVDFFIANDLNMFEMDYLIMCEYFKREKVDLVITEVGMGGRLDSTNVVRHPLLTIIVTIGHDHMEVLGDTLEDITYEKCGIIKDESAVLVGDLDSDLKDIVKEEAKRHNARYIETLPYIDLLDRSFIYRDHIYDLYSYAKYQKHNASVALEAIYYLDEIEMIKMDEDKIYEAFKKTIWQGRFEIIKEEPLVIIDGAHNIEGIKALISSIADIDLPKGILFSAIKGKEYDKMLRLLKDNADEVVLTTFDSPKGLMDIEKESTELDIKVIKDMKEAYDYLYGRYSCIVVCGSLYFLSAFNEVVKV